MDTIKLVGILLVFFLCAVALATPVMEIEQTQAETELIEAETRQTDAQTELTEAQTSQESQKALTEVVKELLAELRAERESQLEVCRITSA